MLKLAWRNLWRNRTRTAIVVTAISFSYAMMLWSLGLNDAAHRRMEESALRTAGGSVLVHGAGYWDSQSSDAIIGDPQAVLNGAEAIDGVELAIPRVIVNGLVRSSRGSGAVRLVGIDPELERRLRDVSEHLAEGSFLAGNEQSPLVLGRGLADDLDASLGDRIVLTATDPAGEVTSALFHLTGIIDSGSPALDEGLAYTTIDAAQRAVAMDGQLTQIGLLLVNDDARSAVRADLRAHLGSTAGDLEMLTWDEAMPELVGFIEIDNAFGYLFSAVIFLVVAFGIANTFLMSVMERTRELGLLSAVGLTARRVHRLLASEAFLLGALSLAVGFAIGFGLHYYFHVHGLDLRELYGTEIEMAGVTMDDMLIRSELRPVKWLVATASVLLLVLLSCLYPAWRATRVDPAQAMRTYQ